MKDCLEWTHVSLSSANTRLSLWRVSAYLGGQKNRDAFGWFLLGFIFSIIALIAIAASSSLADQKNAAAIRKCPYCAEMIQAEAKICRFCQHELPSPDKSTLQRTPLSVEEAKLMAQYGITKEEGEYIGIIAEGLFKLLKKRRFLSLREAVKAMHDIDI